MLDAFAEFLKTCFSGWGWLEVMLVLGFVIGVLEAYLKMDGTRYDDHIEPVHNFAVAIYRVITRRHGGDYNVSPSDSEDDENQDEE